MNGIKHRRKPSDADKIVEAIDRLSNTIECASSNIGKWLGIVAKAASTPEDNSKEIEALTQRAKAVADVLEDAADSQQTAE